jgi:hypothetical protein
MLSCRKETDDLVGVAFPHSNVGLRGGHLQAARREALAVQLPRTASYEIKSIERPVSARATVHFGSAPARVKVEGGGGKITIVVSCMIYPELAVVLPAVYLSAGSSRARQGRHKSQTQ